MFDAYKIGVTVSLTNYVSKGLMLMAGDFAKTEAQATLLQKRINSIRNDAMRGGLMLGAGVGMVALLKAPLDAARDYELAFTKFKTMNLGDTVNREADKFARGANIMGVSAKELMNSMSESVGLFGEFDLAKKLTPILAQLNKANSAIFSGKIDHIDEGSTRGLMKFIDRRGGTHDEATFMRNLDLAQRMVTGSGGFLKFRDLDNFSQMGGTAFRGLSDEGIMNMTSLLQEQGGAKAGTSLMSIYQNLIAGRTPKKTMAMLQEFGLGTLAMQEHATVGGKSMKSMVMTNIKGADLLQSDPATWMRTVFLPALAAKGITDTPGILKATNDMLSNRNASNQASIMTTQTLQVLRDANLTRNAMGVNATIGAYKNDPNSKFADLQSKWNNLMVELGITILPLAIAALEKLIPMLRSMSDWINKNQGLTKNLVGAFVGLAGAMAFGGTVSLLSAGFKGLGLALSMGSVGGVAGVGLLGASLGTVAVGLVALVGAVAGLSWLANTLSPNHKRGETNDSGEVWMPGPNGRGGKWVKPAAGGQGADHAGETFVRSGRGGYWKKDSEYVKTGAAGGSGATINNTIVMPNGQVLARVVTQEQAKSVSGPQSGTGRFDPNMSPISPGQAIR